MKEKVNGWHGSLLSIAGKEVLIKSVLQAIPTYTMGVFQLPLKLCQDISALVAKFWWGKKGGRGIHWKKWNTLCKRKDEGGLGFRDFVLFNQAMLGKQAWRLIENPSSLVAKVLSSRYFPNSNFLEAELGNYPSYSWRSILWGREVVQAGCITRIGDGKNTKILGDNWLPKPSLFRPWGAKHISPNAKVSVLITNDGSWHRDLILNNFVPEDVEAILSLPLGKTRKVDSKRWFYESNGRYSVRSGYRIAVAISRGVNNIGESFGIPVVFIFLELVVGSPHPKQNQIVSMEGNSRYLALQPQSFQKTHCQFSHMPYLPKKRGNFHPYPLGL